MKKENSIKISKASIFFYVAAVIFLVIAVFYLYVTYQSVAEYKLSQAADPTLQTIFSAYLGNCAPFFAYAIGCYGIGLVIGKVSALASALSLCVDDAQVVEIEDEDEDESYVQQVEEVQEDSQPVTQEA